MRSAEQFDAAKRLIAAGLNDCAIARQIGVPRTTVRDWRRRRAIRSTDLGAPCGVAHDFSLIPAEAYCYVLGLYLGDGCISRHRRVWRLRITLDTKYAAIIYRCREAIGTLMPGQRAGVFQRSDGCTEVGMGSKHWPCLFPQHGPGKKHLRPIRLEPWQQALIDQATEEFILGLIHSDGALGALNIPWTRSTKKVVSIYRKAATARLDEFVGPKDRAVPLNGVHYTA
jgi:hypothetical protein